MYYCSCRAQIILIAFFAFISGIAFVTNLNLLENKPSNVTYREYSRFSVKKLEMPWINEFRLNGSIDYVAANLNITAVIFAHIQKTGGTSLFKYLKMLKQPRLNVAMPLPQHSDVYDMFMNAFDGKLELYNKPDLLKISFVRNPWARLVSWWAMIHNNQLQSRSEQRWLLSATPFARYIWSCCPNQCRNFTHFVINCQKSITARSFPLRSIKKDQLSHLINPHDGRWLVDFVGRSETLIEDVSFVVTTLLKQNFVQSDFPWITHNSIHSHYSSYYTDRTTRLVGEWYKRDIEMFNYTFERKTQPKS